MYRFGKLVISCAVAVALILTLSLSCAGDEEEGTTIIIGNLTDQTGVAAPALTPMSWVLRDIVSDINKKEPIPGVKLEVVDYDTGFDPSKFIAGYEYLKERGAQVIVSVFNDASETLKPLAERDKIAILGMATSVPMVDPPGWVFAFSPPTRWSVKAMLKWLEDTWDYEGLGRSPKIISVGWNDAWGTDQERGAREYCQANPDKFEYLGGYLAPVGTQTWSGEVAVSRNADYVNLCATGAIQPATFIKEYREKGGTANFISTEAPSAYVGYIVDYAGWDAVDGHLNAQGWGWWNLTQWDEIKYIRDLLYEYHPNEADDLIHAGMGYLGGGAMQNFALQSVLAAIERVGVENFNGQAYYDTAVNYMVDWAGSQRGFTAERRYAADDCIILEWSAADQDLEMVSDGWVPLIH